MSSKPALSINFDYFNIYEQLKFAELEKSFMTSGPGLCLAMKRQP